MLMNGMLQSFGLKVEYFEYLLLRVVNDYFLDVYNSILDLSKRLQFEDVDKSLISDIPLSEDSSRTNSNQFIFSLLHCNNLSLVDIPMGSFCFFS